VGRANTALTSLHIKTMITSAEEFLELRTSDDPGLYLRAANDTAPEDVWLDVIARYPEMRKWVAHNKTVPLSILRLLAEDPDPAVRSMVAMKRKLDRSLFERLAEDADGGVRLAVVRNPKTPASVLALLTQDGWAEIADVARDRLLNKGST
jgi:hypothetical protein